MTPHPVTPRDKALEVNLDPRLRHVRRDRRRPGSGALVLPSGRRRRHDRQEHLGVRHDGQRRDLRHTKRYVCRERLAAMLDYEHAQPRAARRARGHSTAFFAFADTVSARSSSGNRVPRLDGHALSIASGGAESQIVIHVRMLDDENALQQEALGIVGVNLVYGASSFHQPDV